MTDGTGLARSERISRAATATTRAEAFRTLADVHLTAAYRLARAILGDALEAEDATHDAFESAWKAWHTLRDPDRFEPWFDRILVNTCRNRLRRRRLIGFVRDISDEIAVTDDPASATHDRDVIGRVLSSLNTDQRLVVALRFYRDLTVEEIAGRTGVPAGTVKSRLHHAVAALRAALSEQAREPLR